MKLGDLVMNIYTREIGIMTGFDSNCEYVDVLCKRQLWLVPIDHLEVINESG